MSRVYDLWEKLVGAVLDREELRPLALRSNSSSRCSSFSDYSSCFSFGDTLPTPTLKVYSFHDLKCATRDFRSDMVLGIGDFGTVYKGWVDEKSLQPSKPGTGMMVAIKKLNPQSMQDFDEWQSEVDLFGKLTHPNMVKLLGYCWEDREMLLVYEFMQKGSLENHLFRPKIRLRHCNFNPKSVGLLHLDAAAGAPPQEYDLLRSLLSRRLGKLIGLVVLD